MGVGDLEVEGARGLTEFFSSAGYRHLPRGSRAMFRVEEVRSNGHPIGLIVRFTNPFDAYYLLGRVFGVDASSLHSPCTTSSPTSTTPSPPMGTCTPSRTPPTTTSEGIGHGGVVLGALEQASKPVVFYLI